MDDNQKLVIGLAMSIEQGLRDTPLLYGSLSGSFVYGGAIKGQSDIDLQIVFSPQAYRQKQIIKEHGAHFLVRFRSLVEEFNYVVDPVFPAEFVTIDQIDDAITGRGFHVSTEERIFLPQASDEYYLCDSERWYRAWLSQTAFGRCIVGDCAYALRKKIEAWQTIILFLITSSMDIPFISARTIIDRLMGETNKWNSIGVAQHYIDFPTYELPVIEQALHELTKDNYVKQDNDRYYVNAINIDKWQSTLTRSIALGTIRQAKDFFGLDDIQDMKTSFENWSSF